MTRSGLRGCAVPLAQVHDLLVLDLDGVVYVGPEAVPHAAESIRAARALGPRTCFATNNAARPPREVARHLEVLGIAADEAAVVTSSQAAAGLVLERFGAGAVVLAVGGPGVAEACREVGLRPVDSSDERPVAVVQGYGPRVDWSQLAEVAYAVQAGAWWVATNTDATLPTPRGPAPGNGSLVAAVRAAAGTDPVVAGKPEPTLFLTAAARLAADRPLVVGDRLDTDLAGAVRAGQAGLLVLTGVTRPADLLAAGEGERPAFVAEDLRGLLEPHPVPVRDGGGWACGAASVQVADATVRGQAPPGAAGSLDLLRAACAAAWTDDQGAGPLLVSDELVHRWGRLGRR